RQAAPSVADRQRLARAAPDRFLDLRTEALVGLLDQQVEVVVVAHLEHLGTDLHADGVGLTAVVIDDDLHAFLIVCRGPSCQPAASLRVGVKRTGISLMPLMKFERRRRTGPASSMSGMRR